MLEVIVLEPSQEAKACVIWLHGLGASGDDFVPAVPECELPVGHAVRFVFPHAPEIPVTVNGSMVMPAWYDIRSFSFRDEDEAGIEKSKLAIAQLIQAEIDKGIPAEKIMLIGFSQGGAMALYSALTTHFNLAGVACLSGYLPLHETVVRHHEKSDLPIFFGHGQFDMVVNLSLGQASAESLHKAGFKPNFHTYPIEHTVSAQELRDLGDFIRDTLIP